MEESKIKVHPKVLSILRTFVIVIILILIVFAIAAIRHLSELNDTINNSSNTTTKSILDSFIPTTESPNNEALTDIASILNHSYDPNFIESPVYSWTYNNYMRQLSYYYQEGLNTKMYTYENKTIIYLNDNTGIVKLFIFNTNNYQLITSIKTIIPVNDTYTNSFTVIDGEIYYINSNTYRSDTCLIAASPLIINKYDLTREIEYTFKTYENTTELNVMCS